MSKSESTEYSEISLRGTCLLLKRRPAYRWHDLNLGFFMERGNLMCDAKRKPYKRKNVKGESIDAYIRGGSSRSSGEDPVTGLERRGCVNLQKRNVNQ